MRETFLILGSSQSAGIKALILANDEVPFIKTLGITFLPGSHALVGMLVTEVKAEMMTVLSAGLLCCETPPFKEFLKLVLQAKIEIKMGLIWRLENP